MRKKWGPKDPSPKDQILEALATLKRPAHPRELATRLALDEEELPGFLELIDTLLETDHLEMLPGGRVRLGRRVPDAPPADKKRSSSDRSWEGTISVNPRGFAFVTAPGQDDVFIPPDGIYEAVHGDTVLVQIVRRTDKGLEGRVERVTERRNRRVAGTVRLQRKGAWFEPDDGRIRSPIVVRGDLQGARDGDAVVLEITRFPKFAEELCEGQLIAVLGPQGDVRTEVQKILLGAEVNEQHSPATLANAEEMATRLAKISLHGRRDLRHVPLPTIDPEDARDHDDAIWVERNGKGYRVYVAIADVSEYVQPGSPLDDEARTRGCTIYLPDRAIPMLPRALAADLCSLLPAVDRYCLAVIAELNEQGRVESYELTEAVMRSAARLTYDGVARALGFDDESPSSPVAEAMKSDLMVLAELATKLRKRRIERGALDLDLPEPRVRLDDKTGMPVSVTKRATRPGLKRAYSLVEEMMLLANDLVAEWLTKRKVPTIYRIHAAPDPAKLERLADVGEKLGIKIDVSALSEPKALSELLASLNGHPRADVLSMLLLRSLKQAQYDIDNVGHFGLASPCYTHFTSPIRRYPDLCVHRQVKEILRGEPIDRSGPAIELLRASARESSTRERAAMEVEREVTDLYRAMYMKQFIGETFEGRVTGVTGSGVYVQLDDPFVDVLVKFEQLGPDRYEISDDELSLVGARSGDTVTLGDRLRVTIEESLVLRRTVYGRRELRPEEIAEIEEKTEARPGRPIGRSRPRGELSPRTPAAPTSRRPRAPSESRTFKPSRAKTEPKAKTRSKSEKLLARGKTTPGTPSEKTLGRRTKKAATTRSTTKRRK
ncbi:MAG: ribonuclease R [Sorangiineae bacterium NIC37A_2]|jgi:ribonuclease R|nr:MAG: ribonuclease R [Sorangiineae bacterium NIC37A_2]